MQEITMKIKTYNRYLKDKEKKSENHYKGTSNNKRQDWKRHIKQLQNRQKTMNKMKRIIPYINNYFKCIKLFNQKANSGQMDFFF